MEQTGRTGETGDRALREALEDVQMEHDEERRKREALKA